MLWILHWGKTTIAISAGFGFQTILTVDLEMD
jgi:hypothetical protein